MAFCLLFDIDGTLLSTKGAGRAALQRAMHDLLGVEHALAGESLGGRVDPDLIFSAIERHRDISREHPDAASMYDEIAARYISYLPDTLKASTGASALPGVVETLDWLRQRERVILGVGTGNMAAGAALKLRRCGLEDYFAIGGYGDDASDRPGMLRAGWNRAITHAPALEMLPLWKDSSIFGSTAKDDIKQMLVIGDTTLDISAARAAGFPVAAVATGKDSYETLAEHNPDILWRTMLDGLEWMKQHF